MSETNAQVFVVDDDLSIREALESLLRSAGLSVQTFSSAQDFLARGRADMPSCLVLDVQMPGLNGLDLQSELIAADIRIPTIFITGHGDIPMTVCAIKAGALEFLTKPIDNEDLLNAVWQGIARDRKARQQQDIVERNFEEIIGVSRSLTASLKLVETVGPTDSTVLIEGETGTGKELVARALHNVSGRPTRPFVKINCAAIPSGLLESELFGHERGAFTGAVSQKIGRFELADGGTLFLDEIGDIPLELQPKLLRVLQEQEFERLGSNRTQHVDVRLVAATNRDLEQMVESKQFREDLYFRLNVFPIRLSPLRERPEDIPLLVRHFVDKYARRMSKGIEIIPDEVMQWLQRYTWPGNIRELQNFIERSVVLSSDNQLRPPLSELRNKVEHYAATGETLDKAEREHILKVLEQTQWVIGGPRGAALRLGLKRTTLLSKMQRLGISRSTA